jgi:hypothetical protein
MLTVLTPTYGSTNDDTGFYTLREDDGRFDEAVLRGEQRRISEPRQRGSRCEIRLRSSRRFHGRLTRLVRPSPCQRRPSFR